MTSGTITMLERLNNGDTRVSPSRFNHDNLMTVINLYSQLEQGKRLYDMYLEEIGRPPYLPQGEPDLV